MQNPKQYHPEMHSAEHILNQTMVRMFGCERSFSNHIERKKSKCDYHFSESLSETQIRELQQNVNEVIKQNLTVSEEFLERKIASQRFDLEKLPDSAGETVRIINIGDYDSCPCSGVHVKETLEIGEFHITTWTYEDGVLRLRFKLK